MTAAEAAAAEGAIDDTTVSRCILPYPTPSSEVATHAFCTFKVHFLISVAHIISAASQCHHALPIYFHVY